MRRVMQAGFGAGALALGLYALRRRGEPYDFHGRSALITDGSRGLGLVMARQLAAEGARLTLVARDAAELGRAAAELGAAGADVQTIVADVGQPEEARRAVERAAAAYGAIDVLINNAGIIQAGPLACMGEQDFAQAMAVHFWGPLHMAMGALPHMRRQGSGRIVNVASVGGLVAVPHLTPYCASKFALVGLSDGLRAELASEGVVVTTVTPGLMRTGSHMNAQMKGQHRQELIWFALADSLPATSMDARRAAAQILDGCRHGRARVVVSWQARALDLAQTLAPELFADAMRLMSDVLPGAPPQGGDEPRTGWESRSALVPSILTRLSDRAAVENNGVPTGLGTG